MQSDNPKSDLMPVVHKMVRVLTPLNRRQRRNLLDVLTSTCDVYRADRAVQHKHVVAMARIDDTVYMWIRKGVRVDTHVIEAEPIDSAAVPNVLGADPEPEQAESEQAEPEQAESEQAESEQAEPEQAEPEQAEPEQAEPEQAESEPA